MKLYVHKSHTSTTSTVYWMWSIKKPIFIHIQEWYKYHGTVPSFYKIWLDLISQFSNLGRFMSLPLEMTISLIFCLFCSYEKPMYYTHVRIRKINNIYPYVLYVRRITRLSHLKKSKQSCWKYFMKFCFATQKKIYGWTLAYVRRLWSRFFRPHDS